MAPAPAASGAAANGSPSARGTARRRSSPESEELPSNLILRTVNARHRCTVTATPPPGAGTASIRTSEKWSVP